MSFRAVGFVLYVQTRKNNHVFFSFSEWNQSMHFHYNISYLSEREKILAAEFHVFKMRPAPPKFKESKPPYVIEVIYNPFSLHLWHIVLIFSQINVKFWLYCLIFFVLFILSNKKFTNVINLIILKLPFFDTSQFDRPHTDWT